MLNTILLVLVCAAGGGVLSCEPCQCTVGDNGLQVTRCYNVGLSSVPGNDTLPDHMQVLDIYAASIPTIKENQFVAFRKLQIIDIWSSQVRKIERHAFRNMTQVVEMTLARNLITELPTGLFSDTPGLVELKLYGNNLTVLQENLFLNLINLKIVNLDDNQIASIDENCFKNVPRLEELYLIKNNLTTLNIKIIDDWSSLKVLWLYYNPWHCDESLCSVMAAVVSRGLWKDGWAIPTCTTPESVQWKWWTDLVQQCTPPNNITHLHVTENATELSVNGSVVVQT